MSRERRLVWAVSCSVLCHVLLIALPWGGNRPAGLKLGTQGGQPPMVLNIRPSEPEARKQLVDVHTPATGPVTPTDLIAVAPSQATDLNVREGSKTGPRLDEPSDFDALSTPKTPPPPDTPPVPALDTPQPPGPEIREESPAAPKQPEVQPPKAPSETPHNTQVAKLAAPAPTAPPREQTDAESASGGPPRFSPPAAPDTAEGGLPVSRGRVYDKVNKQGFPGFEAAQSEVAPYLREVRRRVENRWNAMLLTRYSGTSPSTVLIDCGIASDGHLAYVNIAGDPKDRVYAALCKEAVEKAGPFGAFPFKVPDMYRNKNLEIRWTFSFL